MKKSISIFMVIIMTLGIFLGSFSVAFADNDTIYTNSNGVYTFEELLELYLDNVVGYGSLFDSYSCFLVTVSGLGVPGFNTQLGAVLAYNENITIGDTFNGLLDYFTQSDFNSSNFSYQRVEDRMGCEFILFRERSAVVVRDSAHTFVHYFSGATGNRLNTGGGSTGVGRPNNYYVDEGDELTYVGGDSFYEGDTNYTSIIDNSTGDFNNIGDGTVITGDNATTIYNPETSTYYTINDNDNRVYTTNNYITYNTVNYYMPGSDQPLNTWNYFYELPDGRNSATLTEEDIAGLNLDFDVVNYKQATEDLTQKALFHFDGNIENSAPPSNRGLVPGENIFTNNFSAPRRNWYSVGSDLYDDYGNPSSSFYNSADGILSFRPSSSIWYQISVFYFPQGLTSDNYLIEMDVEGLQALPVNGYLTVALIDRNDSDGFYSGRTQFTNISNGKISILADVTANGNFSSNWGLYFQYASQFSAAPLTISNISVRPVEWQYSDSTSFNSAEFSFQQGAGFTFVDTQTAFNAALYLDGNAHIMNITLPDDSLSSVSDFTYSFRHYQETSTSTSTSYVSIGASPGTTYTGASRISIKWTGSSFVGLEYRDSSTTGYLSSGSVVIPVGQWNTITLTRSSNNFLLYVNGLLASQLTVPGNITFADDSNIVLSYAADSNVKYLDEILFASQSLYTENHVPRLIPWDTTNVLVLPDVSADSIAVQATLPITGYRIGGVRPTFPEEGMVWMMVEGDFITMIQIYNGYMWVQVNGAVYYNGHWYQLENFNIHIALDDIDIPPDTDIVNPNNPSSPGGGSGGSGGGWLDTLFQELLSGVVDLIVEAIKALIGLIENVLGAIADFIGACFSVITIPLELVQPIGDFVGAVFSIFPSELQTLYVAGFALIILVSVVMWISGKH